MSERKSRRNGRCPGGLLRSKFIRVSSNIHSGRRPHGTAGAADRPATEVGCSECSLGEIGSVESKRSKRHGGTCGGGKDTAETSGGYRDHIVQLDHDRTGVSGYSPTLNLNLFRGVVRCLCSGRVSGTVRGVVRGRWIGYSPRLRSTGGVVRRDRTASQGADVVLFSGTALCL